MREKNVLTPKDKRTLDRWLSRFPFADLKRRYNFYKLLRLTPENRQVRRRDAVAPTLATFKEKIPGLAGLDRQSRPLVLERDLQLLNDVLAQSPIAGRYWTWSGLLLGWAREGRILPHDARDADFAYAAQDDDRFRSAFDALVDAGFHPWFRFRSNTGEVTEYSFVRRGARFDFYRFTPVDESWEYHVYGSDPDQAVELVARLPCQRLEPFQFLGRTWLKVTDHEAELEELYGDWRTPDPGWNYLDQGGVVERRRWTGGSGQPV